MEKGERSKGYRVLYRPEDEDISGHGFEGGFWNTVLLGSSLAFTFLTAGLIFGFPALHDVLLIQEGAYSSLCDKDSERPCAEQEGQFRLLVTFATGATSLFGPFSGMFLDKVGPRASACMGSFVFGCGLVALAIASTFGDYLYLCGFVLLAIGGSLVFLSTNNFSALFERNASAVIGAQTGACQISSLVTVAGAWAVSHCGVPFSRICWLYLITPVVIFIASLSLYPDTAYGIERSQGNRGEPHRVWLIRRILLDEEVKNKQVGNEGHLDALLSLESPEPIGLSELSQKETLRKPPELYNFDIWHQVCSVPFLVAAVYLGLFILCMNFSLATIYDQLVKEAIHEGGVQPVEATAAYFSSIFNLSLPFGGLLGIPIVGILLVKLGISATIVCQGLLSLLYLLCLLPGLVPLQWKVVGFFAFGLSRPLAIGVVTNYLAEVFGFQNYGTLFGLTQLLACFGTPIQIFFIWMVERVSKGSYLLSDVCLIIAQLVLLVFIPHYLTFFVFSGFFFRPQLADREKQ